MKSARMLSLATALLLFTGSALAQPQLRNVEWGQSAEKAYLYLPRSANCDASSARIQADSLGLECAGGKLNLDLRSDVRPAESKCTAASRGTVECALAKSYSMHWDRLTTAAQDAQLPRLRVNYHHWYEPAELAEDYAPPRDGLDLAATPGVNLVSGEDTSEKFDADVAKAAGAGAPVIAYVFWSWCDQQAKPCAKADVERFATAATAASAGASFYAVDGESKAGRAIARRLNATCAAPADAPPPAMPGSPPPPAPAAECAVSVIKDGETFEVTVAELQDNGARFRGPLLVPLDGADDAAQKAGGTAYVRVTDPFDGAAVRRAAATLNHRSGKDQGPVTFFHQQRADDAHAAGTAAVYDKGGQALGAVGTAGVEGDALAAQIASLLKPVIITDQAEVYPAAEAAEKAGRPVVYYWTAEKAQDVTAKQPGDWDADEDGAWDAPEVAVHDSPALLEHKLRHVTEVAREMKGKATFISTSGTWEMADFGLDEKADRPCAGVVGYVKGGGKTRHAVREAATAEQLRAALGAFEAGTLAASYKSDGQGTEFVDGEVQVLTGATQHAGAAAASVDVLVLFYSSYGQDAKASDAAADAASALAGSGVRVARLDTAKNGYDARVFPGMGEYDDKSYFFLKTASRKKALRFKGKSSASALLKWMRDKSRRVRAKKTWAKVKANLKALRAAHAAKKAAAEEAKKAQAERLAAAEKVDLTADQDGGVVLQQYEAGTGDVPQAGDSVQAHYTGTLEADGSEFDSSRGRGEPFGFTLGQGGVIKCWDLAFAALKKGAKAVVTCASKYAYGDSGSGEKIPGGATLKFDVELVGFKSAGAPGQGQDEL
eukprot:g2309.t1